MHNSIYARHELQCYIVTLFQYQEYYLVQTYFISNKHEKGLDMASWRQQSYPILNIQFLERSIICHPRQKNSNPSIYAN